MSTTLYQGDGLTAAVISFRFVETEAEYRAVLELRFREYSVAGKVAAHHTVTDMADSFDSQSKIVIALYRGEIVASIRMIIHEVDGLLEQEQFIQWPAAAPRRETVVEATRACVRRDMRGTDLFLSMLTFFGQEAMKLGKKYVVLSASNEMLTFYRRAGAKPLGLSYAHTGLNGKIHQVLIVDINRVFVGEGVSPLLWNLTWGKLYEDPRRRVGIRLTARNRLRVRAYLLLRGAAPSYLKWRLRRKPPSRSPVVAATTSVVHREFRREPCA